MRTSSPKWFISAAAVIAAGLVTLQTHAAGLKTGDTFPDFAGFKIEGKLPESLKGKVLLVDFWASWCEPCKASFPVMEDLHKIYGPKGLVIIAVNVDENKSDMEAFLKDHPATFTIVRDARQKLVERAGAATMPTSLLIDREGKIRTVHSGFRGDETRKKYIEEIESILKN